MRRKGGYANCATWQAFWGRMQGGIAMPAADHRANTIELQLTGEPKSGTTWTEYVLQQMCMIACDDSFRFCKCKSVWYDVAETKGSQRSWLSKKARKRWAFAFMNRIGLQREGTNLLSRQLQLYPTTRESHTIVYFAQALPSKHNLVGRVGSRFPEGLQECNLDPKCMRRFLKEVRPLHVKHASQVIPLLIVRDPRHLVLSDCDFEVRLSYENCIWNDLRTRSRHVGIRYAWHLHVLPGSIIVFYDDLLNDFSRTVGRICDRLAIPSRVCRNTTFTDSLWHKTNKESMKEAEQSGSTTIPGPNRGWLAPKVTSSQVQDRTQKLSPNTAKFAENVLREELPSDLADRFIGA